MKKYMLSGCIALALALGSTVFAQNAAPKQENAPKADKAEAKPKLNVFTGAISAVDATAGTLTVKNDKDETKTFKCAEKCKVVTDEKAKDATCADLKVGDKVTVGFTDENGTLTAKKIGPAKASALKKEKKHAAGQ